MVKFNKGILKAETASRKITNKARSKAEVALG